MNPDQHSVPLSRDQAHHLDLGLVPGLRNRLIAELAARDIPVSEHAAYLRSITGRVLQTVGRWIDAEHPGLPDLASLALLSLQLNLDANWLLGLLRQRSACPYDRLPAPLLSQLYPGGDAPADWVGALSSLIGGTAAGKTGIMRGDEMAPLLRDGTPFFYDDSQTRIAGNGIYLLDHDGRTFVRHVERRIGEGLLLRCENADYADTLLKDTKRGTGKLAVLGRVLLAINVVPL